MSVAMPPIAARVASWNGKPTLFVNDEPLLPQLYALTDCPGGRWPWEETPKRHLRQFAEAGIRLFQVDIWLDQLFAEDDTRDLTLLRRQIATVRELRPDAAVFVRLHVNAAHAWNAAHPEECVAYANTAPRPLIPWGLHRPLDDDEQNALRHSLASSLWRDHAEARVRTLCQALAATPEGNAVAGFQPAGGVFGEWHQWGFIEHEPDSGPAMTRYFRDWLRARYGDDAALQAAWHDPAVTLATAAPPTLDERNAAADGIFRDPQRQRNVIDYADALMQCVAEDVILFCRAVKQSWPRPIVTGAFHGYFKMLFGRQATGGHLHVADVLRSPEVDYLSAPQSYHEHARPIGGSGESRGLLGPCLRHGKLWLDEMDQHTYLGTCHDWSRTSTLADDVALIRRNIVQPVTRGGGQWYYDFGPFNITGWWDDPVLMDEIRTLKRVLDERHARPFSRAADVLVLYDTDVFYGLANRWTVDCVSHTAVDELSAALLHTGVVYDDALLSELEELDYTRYRAVVFANTFLLTPRQQAFIRERVARDGRHLVWNYLPGYSDGQSLSLDRVSDVTGFGLRLVMPPGSPRLIVDQSPFAPAESGLWHAVPVPIINDIHADIFGRLTDVEGGAFGRKRFAEHTAWLCSFPIRSPDVLREVLRQAGAHIIGQANDVYHYGADMLCIHTADGGARALTLPNGRTLTLTLRPRSTVVLDGTTGALLIGDRADDHPPIKR